MLVATTVIEVGVDVPNASLMVIEHAERFGLAQLHQLRGRVGRGAAESTCVLLFEEPLGADGASSGCKVIYENHDGFEIARQDLRIRGPGEFLGARQIGRAAAALRRSRSAISICSRRRATPPNACCATIRRPRRILRAGWGAGMNSSRSNTA